MLKNYKMIEIDSSEQQALEADSKAIQQINFPGELNQNTTIFFHYCRGKRTRFRFFTMNCKGIVNLFCLNIISI